MVTGLYYGVTIGTIPMTSAAKILDLMRREPANVRFNDLKEVCVTYFGTPRQSGTSHAIFKTPWAGDPRINIQDQKGKAKAYQVRQVLLAIDKLEGMKARDLSLIDVRGRTSVTDFLVVASGTSTRHVKAMADDVVEAAKALDHAPLGVEGEREAEWVLVDLGDLIVHLMLPRTREFYGLERIWGVEVPKADVAESLNA